MTSNRLAGEAVTSNGLAEEAVKQCLTAFHVPMISYCKDDVKFKKI
jgi:hypothetical protein